MLTEPKTGSAPKSWSRKGTRFFLAGLLVIAAVTVGLAAAGKSPSALADSEHEGDRQEMLVIYEATGGPDAWYDRDRDLTQEPLAHWPGVKISGGRVVELTLPMDSQGDFPAAVGTLAELRELHAYSAPGLTGSLPAEITGLSKLRVLGISGTGMSGELPDGFGRLANLETLHLMQNRFSGAVPESIEGLDKLRTFNLSRNSFSGPVPAAIGRMDSLKNVVLDSNEFSGALPTELFSNLQLTHLHLRDNEITGPLHLAVLRLKRLQMLDVSNNRLTGQIPKDFHFLPDLKTMYMGGNDFEGCVTDDLKKVKARDFHPEGWVDEDDPGLFDRVNNPWCSEVEGIGLLGLQWK